ncbi:hypothetical protein B0J11DRAFT_505927 [Dendryphion nanum]|uniref:Uncharacterized protein n=1 Tax=Dendryphion nanum TaxID=256645 RepID=A0A9P9DXT1_9PLEO|nr:hypothetical protein B0J11DRAFT_505927 [Dendryphion nanum]
MYSAPTWSKDLTSHSRGWDEKKFGPKQEQHSVAASLAIAGFLVAISSLVQGSVLPASLARSEFIGYNETVLLTSSSLFSKRADDEWLMVIYNDGNPGDQCGGVANNFDGKGSVCYKLDGVKGKVCADLKVEANFGFAKCDFSFRADGNNECGGNEQKKVTVDKGKDSNGVSLGDTVKFILIDCHN